MPNRISYNKEHPFSNKLKTLRLKRGLSIKELATGLKVSYQQIYKYEKGINRISASTIVMIAKILKVPTSYFYDDMDTSNDIKLTYKQNLCNEVIENFMRIKKLEQCKIIANLINSLVCSSKTVVDEHI